MKRVTRTALILLLSVLSLLPIVSCIPASSQRDWKIADLRVLDPVDVNNSPSTDILAVYTRVIGFDLEIRVDLLDMSLVPIGNLQILLDTIPGGNPWDMVIDIPSLGRSTVSPASTVLVPRVIRDPWLDTVTVRINQSAIPQPFTMKVISSVAGEPNSSDETLSVRSDGIPPIQRAPFVLAFWDVFPVSTPAQALRFWDGAHTGPRGERHGLKHILDAVGQYGIPAVLLDLKTPSSLAALGYMGILPQIQNLSSRNLLILPEVAYGRPGNIALTFSKGSSSGFRLPASQFAYNPSGTLVDSLAQFIPLANASQMGRTGETRLIPVPAADDLQATVDGPTLDVRRALVNAAFSGDSTQLVVLGGDIPRSTWANEDIAGPTFAWLAGHPWIKPLNGEDLMTFPISLNLQLPEEPDLVINPYLAGLRNAPPSPFSDSAWQTYFMLTSQTTDEKLIALRANYLGQVDELLAAARWADHPSTYSGCDQDLNNDGQFECALSNDNFFAILSPVGARMTNLFYLDERGSHQLVGPSSQFTIGLSDPSEWQPGLGQAADPSVIPGAFSDDTKTWTIYIPQITPGSIEFSTPDGSRKKKYTLNNKSMEITYSGSGVVNTRIPLALDPHSFYFMPTSYSGNLSAQAWTWRLTKGIKVRISTASVFSVDSFIDSFPYLSQPENPDLGYPVGHYLPFPLSVVELRGSDNFIVQINVK
jgi:hypothetical protein